MDSGTGFGFLNPPRGHLCSYKSSEESICGSVDKLNVPEELVCVPLAKVCRKKEEIA